jgi:hypothetical protein
VSDIVTALIIVALLLTCALLAIECVEAGL